MMIKVGVTTEATLLVGENAAMGYLMRDRERERVEFWVVKILNKDLSLSRNQPAGFGAFV